MADDNKVKPRAYVRLTAAALADLQRLLKKDPQIVRWALKKMLLLERDPDAGEPLLGSLIGWRKLTVGDRDWRIVWRVTSDEAGEITLTVSEVWAVGARSEAEVYHEMTERVASLGDDPRTLPMSSVIELLGRHVQRDGIEAAPEPVFDPVPEWLKSRLVHSAGISQAVVDTLTGTEAMDRWDEFKSTGR